MKILVIGVDNINEYYGANLNLDAKSNQIKSKSTSNQRYAVL